MKMHGKFFFPLIGPYFVLCWALTAMSALSLANVVFTELGSSLKSFWPPKLRASYRAQIPQ